MRNLETLFATKDLGYYTTKDCIIFLNPDHTLWIGLQRDVLDVCIFFEETIIINTFKVKNDESFIKALSELKQRIEETPW